MILHNKIAMLFVCALSVLVLVALAGCGGSALKTDEAKDRAFAESELKQLLAEKRQAQAVQERAQQAAEAEAARRQAELAKPHYAPARLASAAAPRTWAHVKVPDFNVEAVLNTTWTDGQINYRVALLGGRPALESFTHSYRQFQVNFQDRAGSNIFEFNLDPGEFQFDPPSTNGGIPTMETSGSTSCELPVYEQFVQWNFNWSA